MKRIEILENGESVLVELAEGSHAAPIRGAVETHDVSDMPDDEWKDLKAKLPTHKVKMEKGKARLEKRDKDK